uniref:Permease n=1 Tax=Streptomyces sp. NBC_00003 TaxID=2903608 RepID=A0AAU2V437_9ACTN
MRRCSLSWQLLRMGRAAGRRAGDGQVRAVALLLATAVLALGLSAVAATYAAYDGIDRRTAARGVQLHDAFPDRPAVALAALGSGVIQGRQFSVDYVRPLFPAMPLPPGIDRWPGPGEALLSPALSRILRAEGTPNRYGKPVGEIRSEGLASPGERYAYVNPTDRQLDREHAYPIAGFGGGVVSGDKMVIAGRERLLTALYLILLPAGVLIVVAVRMGSAGRDRRTALVSALGGGQRHRALLNLGEAALPVAAGAVLGLLPALGVMASDDVQLPWIDYWLCSADLRRWWAAFTLAGLAAAGVLLVLVCAVHRPAKRREARSTRLAARRSRLVRWAAAACPVLVIGTVRGPASLDPSQYSALRMQLYNTGVVAVMATLPCAVAVGAAALGPRLARWSRRTGDAGALVSGRHAAAHPGVTARLVAGVGIALVLVSQVQLKTVQFDRSAHEARVVADRVGDGILLMKVSGRLSPAQVADLLGQLPTGVETLALYGPQSAGPSAADGSGTALLQGPCRALRAVRLPCSPQPEAVSSGAADRRIVEAVRCVTPVVDSFAVRQAAVLPGQSSKVPLRYVLAAPDGKSLPRAEIEQLLLDTLPLGAARAETPGAAGADGTVESVAHGRWVLFFGVPGVLIVALAVVLANLAEFLRFSRDLAPLSVLTGRRKLYYSAAAWALLVPLIGAIAVSALTAKWLAAPQESPADGVELSPGVLITTSAALAGLALLTWWWGSRAAIRRSAQWRPYGE